MVCQVKTLQSEIFLVGCFNNSGYQDLRLVEVKMNYMILTVAKQEYLLGLVFTLNNAMLLKLYKEKIENEQVIVILN